MKNMNGVAIILLVPARKSADASTTSIAFFKEFHPQKIAKPTQIVTRAPAIPKSKDTFRTSEFDDLK